MTKNPSQAKHPAKGGSLPWHERRFLAAAKTHLRAFDTTERGEGLRESALALSSGILCLGHTGGRVSLPRQTNNESRQSHGLVAPLVAPSPPSVPIPDNCNHRTSATYLCGARHTHPSSFAWPSHRYLHSLTIHHAAAQKRLNHSYVRVERARIRPLKYVGLPLFHQRHIFPPVPPLFGRCLGGIPMQWTDGRRRLRFLVL